jgi:SAM-dependent methyltransferase
MAQYQSFPDAVGDSRTLEKLKGLKLPDLADRSFLDVGCNEGFFCGFAKFVGARRAVGLDHSELFIERARHRFPDCEFFQQGWEQLPQGSFDVILLASALHYAEDQAALVHRLVERLSPDGVLILELGIVSSPDNAWVRVKRGIDERDFPTMDKLREVLRGYAWKWMGRSVSQDGDPVARHVIHVSRRRPVAYLLMQPPAYGKSSIAASLFAPAGIRVVSGDQEIALIAQGKQVTSTRLRDAVAHDYSPFRIDETIRRIFESGAAEDLVHLWLQQAGDADFALDVYVPPDYYAEVESTIASRGYLPVRLEWNRVGPSLLSSEVIAERAEAFCQSIATSGAPMPSSSEGAGADWAQGFVDEVSFGDGTVTIRGWAVDATGALPDRLEVRSRGQATIVEGFERQLRPDVQKHLKLPHALVGYRAILPLPGVASLQDLAEGFAVYIPSTGRIRLAKRVANMLAGGE